MCRSHSRTARAARCAPTALSVALFAYSHTLERAVLLGTHGVKKCLWEGAVGRNGRWEWSVGGADLGR